MKENNYNRKWNEMKSIKMRIAFIFFNKQTKRGSSDTNHPTKRKTKAIWNISYAPFWKDITRTRQIGPKAAFFPVPVRTGGLSSEDQKKKAQSRKERGMVKPLSFVLLLPFLCLALGIPAWGEGGCVEIDGVQEGKVNLGQELKEFPRHTCVHVKNCREVVVEGREHGERGAASPIPSFFITNSSRITLSFLLLTGPLHISSSSDIRILSSSVTSSSPTGIFLEDVTRVSIERNKIAGYFNASGK